MSKIILYHGTTADFSIVDLRHAKENKDFGKGFYLTTDYNQAAELAYRMKRKALFKGYNVKGYVYSFMIDKAILNKLNTHRFLSPNKAWLDYVINNRNKQNNNKLINDYDIVIGKVADANAQKFIDTYLENGDTSDKVKNDLIRKLEVYSLTDQFCFKTSKSILVLNKYGNIQRKEI